MSDFENIKCFVQRTLGCGCPEEVFRHIEYQSNVVLNDIILRNKINIGNRLLIYISDIFDHQNLASLLAFLIHEGKKERDSKGFNRFRLVLSTESLNEIKDTAYALFDKIDKDDKIHLHVIKKSEIPDI